MPQAANFEKSFRFALFGASLNTGNMGVSALAASIVGLVLRHKPGSEIKFFIGNRSSEPQRYSLEGYERLIPVVNFRWSPRAKFHEHIVVIFLLACLWRFFPFLPLREWILNSNRWLREIASADIAGDICGGDSFSDIYGVRRFAFGILPVAVAVLMEKPLYLLPQTYGPFQHPFSKRLARWVMMRATAIISRDEESIALVKEITKDHPRCPPIIFCPDVAFTLASMPVKDAEIDPPLDTSENFLLIGFNVNGLMFNGGYSQNNMFGLKFDYRRFAQQLVVQLLESSPCHILLVPHTFGAPGNINSDPDACQKILELLPRHFQDRIHLVTKQYDQFAIKSLIGRCDLFIGSRMHACIAALSQSIPTFGIAYSKKFLGVFKSVGAGDWVLDARRLDSEEIITKVTAAVKNVPDLKAQAKVNFASIQNLINDTFVRIFI